MEIFQDYAYYYNKFYQNKDYGEEARQIDLFLKKYGKNIHKLINFGFGTGRHDIELVKMGYQCEGIDISPLMIEIAKENVSETGFNIKFSVADIQDYFSDSKYDAVISLFHVMSYQNENKDIMAAFLSARKVLEQGGVFLFDVWYGPGVLSDKPTIRVKEITDDGIKLIRIAKPDMNDKKNLVSVNYEVLVVENSTGITKVINEIHNMRYFFRPELEFMLHESGFELIDNFDGSTLGETGFDSWTSYFIAKAV